MNAIYFRFIQFSLGLDAGVDFLDGSALKGFDWVAFFDFAKKQTLCGVAFDGIRRLPKGVAPPLSLLMKWVGVSRHIEQRNAQLDAATAAIYRQVSAAGYRCCVLKGQGNAAMYPHPAARTPGDVDLWVDAPRAEIRALAHALAKDGGNVADESWNHIGLALNGIGVELHATPGFMANYLYNRRLQQWLRHNAAAQWAHRVALPGGVGEVAVPTSAFNAVYQLYHLYHHYFYEGVGLRQVVDYYFVLVSLPQGAEERAALSHELKRLGLWTFAGAMMDVLRVMMGLSEDRMIAPMDGRRGRMLLDDILCGGNFGHYDRRHAWGGASDGTGRPQGAVSHNLARLFRDARLLRYYPAEAVSEPAFRLWHWWWRRKNPR